MYLEANILTMKILLISTTILFFGIGINAQDLDVAGKAKIFVMDYDNAAGDIVIREHDGTLGRRALSTFQTKRYVVGNFAHGGIVFWVDETGEHGLVCAIKDQSAGVVWHNIASINTWARGDGPRSGMTNTAIIIAAHKGAADAQFAAQVCNALYTIDIINRGVSYNHGDWYLPSKEELNLMYLNRVAINETAEALSLFGGESFSSDIYWSSMEDDISGAWRQDFTNGFQIFNFKGNANRVRAIRAF